MIFKSEALLTDMVSFIAAVEAGADPNADIAGTFDPRCSNQREIVETQASLADLAKVLDRVPATPLPDDPLLASAIQLRAALKHGSITVGELLVKTHERITETDRVLQAHVTVLDAEQRGEPTAGVLAGLPVGIKDIIDIAGLPTKCNSLSRASVEPARTDAEVVRRLREAGAVIATKTVTQEFAAGVVSAPARNPWNPERVPGGSSGGSAVAVAVGAAALTLGSDTGGSIRIPAAVCGVVGLKPTYGRISKRGAFPLSWSLDTLGPITRTVQDAALLFLVLAGQDPHDPTTRPVPAPNVEDWAPILTVAPSDRPRLDGVRLGLAREFFLDAVQPAVAEAFERSLRVFRDLGAEIVEVNWPGAARARAAAMIINRVEMAAVHEHNVAANPEGYGAELRDRLAMAAQVSATSYLRSQQARLSSKREMEALFAEHRLDGLLAPTLPSTAVRADDLFADYPGGHREPVGSGHTRLTQPFNATGQPVLAVPCGFDDEGLPVSLSIAGRPDDELTVCRIGLAYQQGTDWHRRRPTILE